MGPKATSERKQQLLEIAAELLEDRSFSALSFQEIADRAGIRKASVHHHFPAKEDLGVDLLSLYEERFQAQMKPIFACPDGPGATLRLLLESAEAMMLDDQAVCPAAVFEVDSAALPARMAEALRAMKERMKDQFADLLRAGRNAGEIQFLGEPEAQALLVVTAIEGAAHAAPLHGRECFRTTVQQLLRSMGL